MELNEIKDLIKEIQRSKATVLDLSFKGIPSLPPEISEVKNLTQLNISYNQLTSLPPGITELKNLTELYISGNKLTSLPPEISELKYLTELDISSNKLPFLPTKISKLKKLYLLNISSNNLFSLPIGISELRMLTKFHISYNQLSSLPPEISELKQLEQLDLSNNRLFSLPPEISELKHLVQLDLSYNQLSSLPPEISELKYLVQLDLSYNRLTSLPPEILELGLDMDLEKRWKSNTIFLRENPFENPPVEILIKGREAVINYFMSLKDEKEPLNEIKVLLVGEGGAGKTSLVKRLFGEEVDGNEPQTQGINIRKWTVQNGKREIKANFWDFGGQRIMHATHQFLLSKRSLYILMLDGRRDEKPEYWLKLIENFGGDSPVLIVINKIDENPAFDLNRKFLREKYPSIRGFYRLSCKSYEGVEEFSKILQEELTKVKHLEIKWPKSWFNVKSKLEKMSPNHTSTIKGKNACELCSFIEFKDYKNMCDEEGIKNEAEQNTLVDFLHDLGVILYFKDIPLLNGHILEPEWVTNAIYKIVNSKEIARSKGILKLDMLQEILKQNTEKDFYYPPVQYGFFISLMEKFELSYDLDSSTVLLPASLEIQESNFEFDYEGALKFIIDYDFLPPSVMPRFIVKMNRDIKDNLKWRTGVVLENKDFGSVAVIKSDDEAKRIYINVNSGQKRDYFSSILFNLREINRSFEKLKAIEKIPLPGDPEIAVSYEHLVNLEEIGIDSFVPEGSRKTYRVSDLLGTVNYVSKQEESLEELMHILKTENEDKKFEEILQFLRKIVDESDNEETLFRKLNKVIMLKPSVAGYGVDFNEAISLFFKRKRQKS